MKKACLSVLIMMVFVSMVVPGYAVSVAVDKKTLYEKGLTLFDLGRYQEALEQFEQLGNYADSLFWKMYAGAFADIEQANALETEGFLSDAADLIQKAADVFRLLAGQAFQDSENMKTYCKAREYQLKGMRQNALDTYAKIPGTRDSYERYLQIITGVPPFPTQAPEAI